MHYFLLTNYSWMVAKGFYLHTLLVTTFISEEGLVKSLSLLAWFLPFFFTLAYTLLRFNLKDIGQCWINDSHATNILVVLVCSSLTLNFLFLCNIVRVLIKKLQRAPNLSNTTPSHNLLQALRATLLLIPLLGLHYLLTPLKPPKNHAWEKIYEITSVISTSFQVKELKQFSLYYMI
uniref:G-protein coupled receptors family 2 profile 2 domain-containing protein n=1 Tax=Clastoptera arizonana TaxID=38151 RepID=A0A1B6DIB3_9HEMI